MSLLKVCGNYLPISYMNPFFNNMSKRSYLGNQPICRAWAKMTMLIVLKLIRKMQKNEIKNPHFYCAGFFVEMDKLFIFCCHPFFHCAHIMQPVCDWQDVVS